MLRAIEPLHESVEIGGIVRLWGRGMNWRLVLAGFAVAAMFGCAGDHANDRAEAARGESDIPHVNDEGAIRINPGEQFTITFAVQGDSLTPAAPGTTDDPSANRVDLSFIKFENGMMLTVANPMSRDLKYDAMMKAPDDRLVHTSSCPVKAGLSTFESWPHEINYLELSNFRLLKDGEASPCE